MEGPSTAQSEPQWARPAPSGGPYQAIDNPVAQDHAIAMHGNPLYNWSSFTGPSGRPASASPAWKAPGSAGRAQMTVHVAAQEEDEHDIAEVYIQTLLPSIPHFHRRIKWYFWVTMLVVVAHIVVAGYTDPFASDNQTLQILIALLQIIMLVLSGMAFFVLTSQMVSVRLGRYDLYLKTFRWLYLMWTVELALVIATSVYYIVLVTQDYSYLQIWATPSYYGLWVTQRLLMCVYWVAIAYNSFKAMDEKHYDPNKLVTGGSR